MFSAHLARKLGGPVVGPSARHSFHSLTILLRTTLLFMHSLQQATPTKSRVGPFAHQPQLESASKAGLSTPLSADLEERGQSRTLLLPKREPSTRVTVCSFVGHHQSITHLLTLSHLADDTDILGLFFLSFPVVLKQVLCKLVTTETLTRFHLEQSCNPFSCSSVFKPRAPALKAEVDAIKDGQQQWGEQ